MKPRIKRFAAGVAFAIVATLIPVAVAPPAFAADPTCDAVDGVRLATNNDTIYNGFWCLNGSPVNDGTTGEGLVFNLRAALALVDYGPNDATEEQYDYGQPNDTNDDWDDPDTVGNDDGDERNLAEFIGSLDDHSAKGLDMITVSLMAGFAGYTCNDDDPMKGRPGWTAWEEDGGLTELTASAEADLDAIIEAADAEDIIINIQMFYQASQVYPINVANSDAGQATLINRVQEANDYIANFVDNQHTDGHRNITIELANEITKDKDSLSKAGNYPAFYLDGPYPADSTRLNVDSALEDLQDALEAEGIGRESGVTNDPIVPVSVSKSGGNIFGTASFRKWVDFYSVHENSELNSTFVNRSNGWITKAKGTSTIWDRPIVVTEEDIDNEAGAQEASALAFTQSTTGSFDLGVTQNVSPNITLFGCEAVGLNGTDEEPFYTDTEREYAEGFQSLPVNWSPTSSTLKTTIFNDMASLTGGGTTTPPDDVTFAEMDSWVDEEEGVVIDRYSFSGEVVTMQAGQTYLVAVNTADSKNKNGGVDLAADPDPVSSVTLQDGGSTVLTASEFTLVTPGGPSVTWYGATSNTTERQRFQVFKFEPTQNVNGHVLLDYGSGGTFGTATVAVVEVAAAGGTEVSLDLANGPVYAGGQSFTTPDFTTDQIDHADVTDEDAHLSVLVVRDQTVVVTPETGDGWASYVQVDTTDASEGPHVTLDVSGATTYDTDNEHSYFFDVSKRYAGAIFEVDSL